MPFDEAAADQFATVRQHLESLVQVIGPYDMQIAAIALANGCALATHNTTEFSRVPGLVTIPLLKEWAFSLGRSPRVHRAVTLRASHGNVLCGVDVRIELAVVCALEARATAN